jgi:hypothetical protein
VASDSLFRHFGKQDLQVATTDPALDRFHADVIDPAPAAAPGAAPARMIEILRTRHGLLVEPLNIGRGTGERPGSDPRRLAFRLHASLVPTRIWSL